MTESYSFDDVLDMALYVLKDNWCITFVTNISKPSQWRDYILSLNTIDIESQHPQKALDVVAI